MYAYTSQDHRDRILNWTQQVSQHIQQHNQHPLPASSNIRTTANGMRLRDRCKRKALAEISINPHKRGRTVKEKMVGKKGAKAAGTAELVKRGRGRPQGSTNRSSPNVDDESYNDQVNDEANSRPASIPDLPPPSDSSAKTPQSRESGSPSKGKGKSKSKKGERTYGKPIPDASINIDFLQTCDPPVFKRSLSQVRATGKPIPDAVIALRRMLLNAPNGVPGELKVRHCHHPSGWGGARRADRFADTIRQRH